MKIAFTDTHSYDREAFQKANQNYNFSISFFDQRLDSNSVAAFAGFDVICAFVDDKLDREVLQKLGCRFISLRSAGFNNLDLQAAKEFKIEVARVPSYSPQAVAEHAVALLLTLNRKTHRAFNRVRELNFSLEGLTGFNLFKKKVGILGVGQIGEAFARIMHGFGCELIGYDLHPKSNLIKELGLKYYDRPADVWSQSDILSLHLPLNTDTYHILNEQAFSAMKDGVYLINTGRGALIETRALIQALKRRSIGGAALDVYEEEEGIFFHDLSSEGLTDDSLARLISFPNVLITSHQGFLTREAMSAIAETSLKNIQSFFEGRRDDTSWLT